MHRLPSLAVVGLALTLVGCSSAQKGTKPASVVTGSIKINLDLKDSSKSFGVVPLG